MGRYEYMGLIFSWLHLRKPGVLSSLLSLRTRKERSELSTLGLRRWVDWCVKDFRPKLQESTDTVFTYGVSCFRLVHVCKVSGIFVKTGITSMDCPSFGLRCKCPSFGLGCKLQKSWVRNAVILPKLFFQHHSWPWRNFQTKSRRFSSTEGLRMRIWRITER